MIVKITKADIILIPETELEIYDLGAIFGWPSDKSKRDFTFTASCEGKISEIKIMKKQLLSWFVRDGNFSEAKQ